MQTLIKPEVKLEITTFDNSIYPVTKKLVSKKSGLTLKFYQKLILILLTSSVFLIFPESPKNADYLCNKYNSKEACTVW